MLSAIVLNTLQDISLISTTFELDNIHTASALTHAHKRSMLACGIYSFVLWELLKSPSKASIRYGLNKARRF